MKGCPRESKAVAGEDSYYFKTLLLSRNLGRRQVQKSYEEGSLLTGEHLVTHRFRGIEDTEVSSGPDSYALQNRTQHLVS